MRQCVEWHLCVQFESCEICIFVITYSLRFCHARDCSSFFFFDIRFIVHREFIPRDQTVNREFNCEVLRRLKGYVRRKRPYAWIEKDLIFSGHHQHSLTREFHAKYSILSHPPYPPDVAPADFHRFSK